MTKEEVLKALSYVIDPELKKDIVALQWVEDLRIDEEGMIRFTLRVNNPALHHRQRMIEACQMQLRRFLGEDIKTDITVVPLNAQQMKDPSSRMLLPGVQHVIAVASGKGGVGKSTVAANLAAGLAQRGYRVGLVDADIYGPSVPIMFGLLNRKPGIISVEQKQYINPLESFGVKLLSIGFFADSSQAVVWRGPMAVKALMQMFTDAYWGELDYMIVDLPPGTGDIHLSLVQKIPLTGAIVVSTPQSVAMVDAEKAINMFMLPQIGVRVLGLVENMSYFIPEDNPDKRYYIFGKDGVRSLSDKYHVPLLGQVPLIESIREDSDKGMPAVLNREHPKAESLQKMIENVLEVVKREKQGLSYEGCE